MRWMHFTLVWLVLHKRLTPVISCLSEQRLHPALKPHRSRQNDLGYFIKAITLLSNALSLLPSVLSRLLLPVSNYK